MKSRVQVAKLLKPLVGPVRFELTTSCTPSKRASQAAPRPETPLFYRIRGQTAARALVFRRRVRLP